MVLTFSLVSVYHLTGVSWTVHVQGCAARNCCVSTLVGAAAGTSFGIVSHLFVLYIHQTCPSKRTSGRPSVATGLTWAGPGHHLGPRVRFVDRCWQTSAAGLGIQVCRLAVFIAASPLGRRRQVSRDATGLKVRSPASSEWKVLRSHIRHIRLIRLD